MIPKGRVEDLEHGSKRGLRSDLGEYLAELFDADVDIRTGSGFLNYPSTDRCNDLDEFVDVFLLALALGDSVNLFGPGFPVARPMTLLICSGASDHVVIR